MADPAALVMLRGALAVLLLSASMHKLRDLGRFRAAVGQYAIIPGAWVAPATGVLVALELAVGVSLLLPRLGAIPGGAAAALLSLYTTAVVINLYRGRRDIDCGCAGPAGRLPLTPALVARNAVVIAGAMYCMLPSDGRSLVWVDVVTVTGGIWTLALVYVAVEIVLANRRWPSVSGIERLSWSTR